VREDQEMVDKLVSDLKEKGALIWLDRDAINPGQLCNVISGPIRLRGIVQYLKGLE
jgi:hypothetical protein